MPGSRRVVLFVVVVLTWLTAAMAGIGWGPVIVVLDWGYCESEVGDSNYGELSWSVVPPGPVCTWTVESNGFAATRGPTPVMSIWLVTLAVLAWAAVKLWQPIRACLRSARPKPR